MKKAVTILAILGILGIALFAVSMATASTDTQKYTSIYFDAQGNDVTKFCNYKDIKPMESHQTDKNKQVHPSYTELMDCINNAKGNGNFIESASKAATNSNDKWPWDIWQASDGTKFISFYYSGECTGPNCNEKVETPCTNCDKKDEKKDSESSWTSKSYKINNEEKSSAKKDDGGYTSWISDKQEKVTDLSRKENSLWGESSNNEKSSGDKVESHDLTFDPPKDEKLYSMSNEQKIESALNYCKAAGFDNKELDFLGMVLTYYWKY
jgi:hypothetical protein